MTKFRFTQDYVSSYGVGQAGDVVEFDDDELAAAINRDSPGTLEPVKGAASERVVPAPPADRMVRAAPNRAFPDGSPESRVAPAEKEDEEEDKPEKPARGKDDRQGGANDQGAMSKADHKAVKDKGAS